MPSIQLATGASVDHPSLDHQTGKKLGLVDQTRATRVSAHSELSHKELVGRSLWWQRLRIFNTYLLLNRFAVPLLSKHGKNFQMFPKQTEKKEQQEMLKFMTAAPRSRVDSTHNALTKRLQRCHSTTGVWHESCKPGRGHLRDTRTCAQRGVQLHHTTVGALVYTSLPTALLCTK